MTRYAIAALALLAVAGSAELVEACSVCYGDPTSAQVKAMQAGILVLLGCIGTVLAGFAGLFCYWLSRSQKLALANEGAID